IASTRIYSLFPYTTLFRSEPSVGLYQRADWRLPSPGADGRHEHPCHRSVGKLAPARPWPASTADRRNPSQLAPAALPGPYPVERSEEHTSELQSRENLVCR